MADCKSPRPWYKPASPSHSSQPPAWATQEPSQQYYLLLQGEFPSFLSPIVPVTHHNYSYSDSVHSADFYDLYTATGSDNSSYSRGSMDNRRPPGPDRSAAQRLNIPPSSFHIHSDRHDRRYSDASDVLPIDIDHRQRSSSGSSGSPSHNGWDRDNYAATVNPAGLLTPPGSVLSSLPSPQSPLLVGPSRPQRQQSFQQLQVPCTCTFYELGNANMSLYPPGDVDNQTPLYSVHVSPSCFQPMSFVTTVKRGGINSKQLMARFE